ncbi:MAG: hypothetical protein ACI389_02295 [Methanobrevibacter sp.]|uniref:hypothetical protein n=1 Tax=Methanobrevibacter sp. TaxID=66852 RepID=UPI003EFFFB11
MKVLQFDSQFIWDHMDELIHLEDYVPEISFKEYNKQDERDDFLKSKNLLETMQEMDQRLDAKCKLAKNPIKARNSIIIEWLDCHHEFEGIIVEESLAKYYEMKSHYEDFTFIDLLFDVELPSEVKPFPKYEYRDDVIHKDDSSIKLPDFNKKRIIYDKYGASLLAAYLAYLV